MNSWVRLWHDMPTDPKFRTIARVSKQALPTVVAIFTFMLTDASANETERGRTTATDENIASAFDLDETVVSAVREAMQGRVLDGDRLTGWENRQPKKEDNSAERAKAWREQQKSKKEAGRSRTTSNETERSRTQDKDTDKDTSSLRSDVSERAKKTPSDELAVTLDPSHVEAVLDHRRKIKKPLTAHAAKLLAAKFGRCPDANAAADAMISNGWQGFEPEWLERRGARGAQAPPKLTAFQQRHQDSINAFRNHIGGEPNDEFAGSTLDLEPRDFRAH